MIFSWFRSHRCFAMIHHVAASFLKQNKSVSTVNKIPSKFKVTIKNQQNGVLSIFPPCFDIYENFFFSFFFFFGQNLETDET